MCVVWKLPCLIHGETISHLWCVKEECTEQALDGNNEGPEVRRNADLCQSLNAMQS